MGDLYDVLFGEKEDSNKAFFYTDSEGRVRFAGGPGAGGGSGGGGGSGVVSNPEVNRIFNANKPIYDKVQELGFDPLDLPAVEIQKEWENLPIIKALRTAERATGITFNPSNGNDDTGAMYALLSSNYGK